MNLEIKVTSYFVKRVKKLKKKYRQIAKDLDILKEMLFENPSSGTAITGLYGKIYKIRIPSSDTKKGKSGGFRVIYYYILDESSIYLLDIYTKSEYENIAVNEILKILKDDGLDWV